MEDRLVAPPTLFLSKMIGFWARGKVDAALMQEAQQPALGTSWSSTHQKVNL
jgi:hypothetical protein